jgi:O-acetyl-ADP-ribose deacetylase (regulator of RNase III)
MVEIREGSVLDADAQTLVNTVNCVGVMGKGIALAFREQFPQMFRDYVARCEREEVHLGEPYLFRQLFPPWILNFPTKGHWRARSRLKDIEAGLAFLEAHYREWGIESLAVPLWAAAREDSLGRWSDPCSRGTSRSTTSR